MSLSGLGDREVLAWMETGAGQTLEAVGLALRDALMTETDGKPFFVGEFLRHLAETGALQEGSTVTTTPTVGIVINVAGEPGTHRDGGSRPPTWMCGHCRSVSGRSSASESGAWAQTRKRGDLRIVPMLLRRCVAVYD